MPRIAISYRRDDSEVITGRLFDRLAAHYGRDAVFRDIDSIPAGVDFRQHINHVLNESDILLAIVGPRWLGRRGTHLRLNDEADPVRIEIETCLRKQMPVVPVLVLGATMPSTVQLPDSMKDFAYRNAVQVDAGRDFDVHSARLIHAMDDILQQKYDPARGGSSGVARPSSAAAADAAPKMIRPLADGNPASAAREAATPVAFVKRHPISLIAGVLALGLLLIPALNLTPNRLPPNPPVTRYDGDYVGQLRLVESLNNDPQNCTMVKSEPILRIINGSVDVAWSANAHVAGPVAPDGSINLIGRHQNGSEVHFNAKIQGATITGQWQSVVCQVSFELHKRT